MNLYESIKNNLKENDQPHDLTWVTQNYEGVDWVDDDDRDFSYTTLVKSISDAERFNYHSDYWGDADTYQQENVDLMTELEEFVGKTVKFDSEDEGYITGVLKGIAIDKQYNSLSHTAIVLEEIQEFGESQNKVIEAEINPDAQQELWSLVDEHTTGDEMIDAVCKKYNISKKQAVDVIRKYEQSKKERSEELEDCDKSIKESIDYRLDTDSLASELTKSVQSLTQISLPEGMTLKSDINEDHIGIYVSSANGNIMYQEEINLSKLKDFMNTL